MYDEIVKKYRKELLCYCRLKLNGSTQAAEDVTQEVFFILFKKLNKLTLGDDIRYWLYKAADREIKTYIRKNPSFIPFEECADITTEDFYPNIEESKLDCLSSEEKELFSEYYSGSDRKKVAKKHGLTMNSLYIRICKIKKKIEDNLSESDKI